jgi:hypothetical protein
MKIKFLQIIVLSSLILIFYSSCKKDDGGVVIKTYSIFEDIIYPPDSFQIAIRFVSPATMTAKVKFQESSVWEIEKMTAFNSTLWINRSGSDTTEKIYITDKTQIGFEEEQFYDVSAKTNLATDSTENNLYIRFIKQDKEYEYFEPKL